jgi:site-specific recombinase XerD
MFEQFVKRPFHLALYRNGPYAEERSRFLAHLVQEGRGRNRLKVINWLLLEVAKYIDLSGQRLYTTDVLTATAERWQKSRESKVTNLRRARIVILDFVFVASSWLRFLRRFDENAEELPYEKSLGEFFAFLREERGLAKATILGHERSLKPFLSWLVRENILLSEVSPRVISNYFSSEVAGRWKRVSVAHHVQSLRSFFRYSSQRGRCTKGIAESIDAPRLYTYENLPQGPSWEEVQKLLASVGGSSPLQIRSRCAILLFAVYGFRVGEVCRLRLEDIDWTNEKITLRRFKQGKVQTYPLTTEVGNALLRYLKEVRPRSACREVFLTLRQPYRPISVGGFSTMVQKQQKQLGLRPRRFGPHALRHACATRLLAQGLTLKEVGDHLGHVSVAATRVYAKVDLPSLREVAAFDVKLLVNCIAQCEQTAAPFYKIGEFSALREVAGVGLGGVA